MIDITFDFRSDTPKGKDPDAYSPTLRKYHQILWSKNLPNGFHFTLNDTHDNAYLYHSSNLGEFYLSSDTATHTFSRWKSMSHIIQMVPVEEIEEFRYLAYTIGSMLIFPSNRINGKSTINGARGFHPLIKDRVDLTLECIRRHYANHQSPLGDVIQRYADFFKLFENFKNYVDYFLLNDLVSHDYSSINFFLPFNEFKSSAVPKSFEEYMKYKSNTISYIQKRNKRIKEYFLPS